MFLIIYISVSYYCYLRSFIVIRTCVIMYGILVYDTHTILYEVINIFTKIVIQIIQIQDTF